MRQSVVTKSDPEIITTSSGDNSQSFQSPSRGEEQPTGGKFFAGQQSDETVLYHAKQSQRMLWVQIALIICGGIIFLMLVQLLANIASSFIAQFQIWVSLLVVGTIAIIIWWLRRAYDTTEIYVTDRRIVKFLPVVPYRRTMRSLFWDEAIKAKTYYRNIILEKLLGIGSVEVHGRNHERDNVDMDYLIYHEDLGHYIDKILYAYKTKPEDIKHFHKFVPKPVGQRY